MYFQINVDRFCNGRMQIVTLYGTRSAAASGKSLCPVEMEVGSLSYTGDLLRVVRENPLVSYPILDAGAGYVCCGCCATRYWSWAARQVN